MEKLVKPFPKGFFSMHSFAIRFLLLLDLLVGLPSVVGAPMAHASPQSGAWQVLGAARSLPTLYRPTGLAIDAKGNVYVADSGNFRVVEIGPRGQLLAHFGEADLRPGLGAPPLPSGQEAMGPRSLAVDSHSNVYVADSINHYIRVFSPQHHLVGDWPIGVSGATVLQLAVAIGGRGNVMVAIAARVTCRASSGSPLGPSYCATYYLVQRRSPAGALLGQFHSPIGPSGQAVTPDIISQIATAVDTRGNIYVATGGVTACYKDCPSFHILVKHASNGKVLARWGAEELDVSASWPALAMGGRGNLFLADDYNHHLDKRTPTGTVLARWSFGSLIPALSIGPSGVAVDRNGAIYLSDSGSDRILKLSSHGKLLSQWGAGGSATGQFWFPAGVALDARRRLWVDDWTNSRVQVLGPDGRFQVQFAVAHLGPAMALDRQGNIYIGRRLGLSVSISKFAASGKLLARWDHLHLADLPTGIAVAANGDIFIAGFFIFGTDRSQLALNGEDILRLNAGGQQIGLFHVNNVLTGGGLAIDAQENSYIAFGGTPAHIEKRSRDGVLVASWGFPLPLFEASPAGIALDSTGNIYVANTPQDFIEKFGPDGRPLNSWGFPGSYSGQFHHPGGIAVDANGALYVADTDNHRIQRLAR